MSLTPVIRIANLIYFGCVLVSCQSLSVFEGAFDRVPPAPVGLKAIGWNHRVTLVWSSVPEATTYNVYWSTKPGVTVVNGNKIANVSAPFTHEGLKNQVPYYYAVTAVSSKGESSISFGVEGLPLQLMAYVVDAGSNVLKVYEVTSSGGLRSKRHRLFPNPDDSEEMVFANYADSDRAKGNGFASNAGSEIFGEDLVPVGENPQSLAVDPKGRFLYVANFGDNSVSAFAIDSTTGDLESVEGDAFPTGLRPVSIAVAPSGRFVFVADFESSDIFVYSVDSSNGGLATVPGSPFASGSHPSAISLEKTGKFAYVANEGDDTVSVFSIDRVTGSLRRINDSTYRTGSFPMSTALDPAGSFLYVANYDDGTVSAYRTDKVSGELTVVDGSPFKAGNFPLSIAVDPSGHFVYVANELSHDLSGFRVDPSGRLSTISGSPFPTGIDPEFVTVDPTGRFVYVANDGDNTVSAYSVDSKTGSLAPVKGSPFFSGRGPYSIAVAVSP